MARFEVAVSSPLAFRDDGAGASPIGRLSDPPETAGISFEGRLFVWHVFEPREDPTFGYEEYGPTVTIVVTDEVDERQAADSLQRFLSAVAFHYDQPADATGYGGSGESDPFHPAVLRARKQFGWTMMHPPPESVAVGSGDALGRALGYYREGLNASSPFYRFLAFWNTLDAVFEVEDDATRRDDFIRSEAQRLEWRWEGESPDDLPTYLARESRNALAHVFRPEGRTQVHPDFAVDRARLGREADWLRWAARAAIEQESPDVVTITRRID